ncbi:MAG: FAD-dependent oxidoreductase, partial [Actinobacteria bacterium]|nr:FAD-dependent oxidoreductase [Actinomycetota bacterium]
MRTASGGVTGNRQRIKPMQVVVIGAGLAGLCAARDLVDAGHLVTVLEKSRASGGRCATRRIGNAVFDHGAQFFTVRS